MGALLLEGEGPKGPRLRAGLVARHRRLGKQLKLTNRFGALTAAGTQAVGARVAPADDDDVLALGGDVEIGVHRPVTDAAVLLGQKLHRKVNAVEVAAGNL